MNRQYKTQRLEPIPYAGVPAPAFCSITFKSKSDPSLTDEDFFNIRDQLLTFLLPYKIKVIFPFGFTNERKEQLMLCFECSREIKDFVYQFLYTTKQYDRDYNITFNFDVLQ